MLALVNALREKNLDYETIHAFDLTPAMLARFQRELKIRHHTGPADAGQTADSRIESELLAWRLLMTIFV